MELTAEEGRVLGTLIEKRMTTPDHYPLSTVALVNACNQSSNRDPVVSYGEQTVLDAVNHLRERGMARSVKRTGERAMKHAESVADALDLDDRQPSLLAVLLLRGPQTTGELRLRTERYCEFASLEDAEAELIRMASADIPTVTLLEKVPGQKEPRWIQLLCGAPDPASVAIAAPAVAPPDRIDALRGEVDDLKERVAELRDQIAELRALFD